MPSCHAPPPEQLPLDGVAGHLAECQVTDPPWADPRPELTDDHESWSSLLEDAYRIDRWYRSGAFQALHELRAGGTRLVPGNARRWRLVQADDVPMETWDKLCRQLTASTCPALKWLGVELEYEAESHTNSAASAQPHKRKRNRRTQDGD